MPKKTARTPLDDIQQVLFTEAQVQAKVAQLGKRITKDYEGKEIVVVGVLRGAVVFLADLIRHINVPLTFDFVATSSYGTDTKSSGVVRILKDLNESIESQHVLIVEDIIDTGLTLNYLVGNFRTRNVASLRVCAFLDKPSRRKVDVSVDYCGFTVPAQFVVGYGLDYAGRYRNLPLVGVLKPEIYGGH